MVQFSVNLASPAVATRRKIFRIAVAASLVLLALTGADLLQWRHLRQETAALDLRAAQVSLEVRQAQAALLRLGRSATPKQQEDLQGEIAAVNLLLQKKHFSWSAFLSDLERQVSQDIAIHRIQPGAKGEVVLLDGVARSLPALTAFVNQMQNAEMFAEVFLLDQKREESEIDDEEAAATSFSIRFRYRMGGGNPT